MNLFQFLTNLTIVVTGFLMKDLSARNFVLIGSSITFLGLVLTTFVTTLSQLIFTFSIMIGIGLGLLNPAAFVAVLSCFTCKRTYAISIGFAALGFGQLIMPMIVKQCLADYGLQYTLYIMSGFAIIGLIGGSFLVPIKWKPTCVHDLESQPLIIRKSIGKSSILMEIIQATDLDLLWNFKYIVIIFGLGVVFVSSTNMNIIFPIYLQKQMNYDSIQIENCMLTITVSDIFTRLAYPLISKMFKFRSRYFFMIGAFGLGAVRLILLHMDLENYKLLLIVCSALGFFRALTVVNQVLILVDFCEENCPTKLPGTLGLSVVIKAIMLVIFSWAFNGMRVVLLNLSLNFYSQIFLFLALIFIWLLEPETNPQNYF